MEQDIFGRPVVTAAEKQAMTAQERRESFEAGIVWDLDMLPAGYLDGLRARAQDRIARRDAEQDSDQHGQRDMPNVTVGDHHLPVLLHRVDADHAGEGVHPGVRV